jgi:hypothetical protein
LRRSRRRLWSVLSSRCVSVLSLIPYKYEEIEGERERNTARTVGDGRTIWPHRCFSVEMRMNLSARRQDGGFSSRRAPQFARPEPPPEICLRC